MKIGKLHIALIFLFCFSILVIGKEKAPDSLFQLGVIALADEDFEVAEGLLLQDIENKASFEAYYNLSQTYIGQENFIKAYWAAEKAIKYAPNNNMTKENIRYILGELNVDTAGFQSYTWMQKFILSIRGGVWFIIGIVFSLICAFQVYQFFSTKKPNYLTFSILTFLVLIFIIFAGSYQDKFYNSNLYATPSEKQIETFAGKDGVQLNQVLTAGQRYKIIKEKDGWIKVEFIDGQPVWVEKERLHLI